MVFFVGYNMFIFYVGIKEEYKCVWENVGVFDVFYMGEFIVKGCEVLDLIQKVISNDVSKFVIG